MFFFVHAKQTGIENLGKSLQKTQFADFSLFPVSVTECGRTNMPGSRCTRLFKRHVNKICLSEKILNKLFQILQNQYIVCHSG